MFGRGGGQGSQVIAAVVLRIQAPYEIQMASMLCAYIMGHTTAGKSMQGDVQLVKVTYIAASTNVQSYQANF